MSPGLAGLNCANGSCLPACDSRHPCPALFNGVSGSSCSAPAGAMPGMDLIEPYCEQEVGLALQWAISEATGPVYIRLVSVPWDLGFEPPGAERLERGRGTVLREGPDAVMVATGPVMVSQAWEVARALDSEGLRCTVVALPWLRDVDGTWLAEVADGSSIVCLDNHYSVGGQGDAVLAAGQRDAKVFAIGLQPTLLLGEVEDERQVLPLTG